MTALIVEASTAFGLATVVAALTSGALPPADRTVLLVTNNAGMPEATDNLLTVGGADALTRHFDAVVDYNALIEPQHPRGWHPREEDLPLWERAFAAALEVDPSDVLLLVESIQVDPGLGLCRIFGEAAIQVYGDGLMSYGPTRNALPSSVAVRIERLLHLDLVPGLAPVLLSEWEVPSQPIDSTAITDVIAAMAGPVTAPLNPPAAVVLGQYLSAAGLLTEAEENDLYLDLITAARDAGFTRVIFKPHPTAPPSQRVSVAAGAGTAGVDLEVAEAAELVEVLYARGGVGLVAGCFSTGLMTARTLYGLPAARHGTELMLERLTPYQNSNRIPASIVDAVLPDVSAVTARSRVAPEATPGLRPGPADADLPELVRAISYAMQAARLPQLREPTIAFLTREPERYVHYFKRRRLTRLGLPGGLPPRTPSRRSVLRRRLGRLRRRLFRRTPVPPPSEEPAL